MTIPEEVLADLEARKAEGLTSSEILKLFEDHELKFSEATLRKYVQLGLLPRSVRVGKKGKHTGSQGLYPATIVRQIVAIKQMMAENLTIEDIKREVWFVRGDIEELERRLEKIFATLRGALKKQRSEPTAKAVGTEIGAAEVHAKELLGRLVQLEERLTTQARLARRVDQRSAAG
mgnify:FL=1